ncbi:MAG TPA: hypothetical protein EYP53_08055 [Candidatus Latescibacteria bacterium]|nr:hypothetical protein [Candidatus Latescibacterota bacterium]
MAVEAIIDKIMADAKAEAEEIKQKAEKEIEKIKEEQRANIERIRVSAEEEGKIQAEEEKRRLISAAELDQRQRLLREKQDLIEETFKRAMKRVIEMGRDDYCRLIEALLIKAVDDGDEEVIISPKDEDRITQELLERVNLKLSEDGRKGQLKLSDKTREMAGGFVLTKGRKEVNCSLESIFSLAREELEGEVAGILFEDKGP